MNSEDIESSFDSPTADVATASKDDDMEAVASEPASKPMVAVRPTDAAMLAMDADAASKGYGKAYAAFGGGREGLEACTASENPTFWSILCCHRTKHVPWWMCTAVL